MSGPAARPGGGWASAVPELCIAAVVVACGAVTGYAAGGLAGTAVVMAIAAVAALVVLRVVAPGAAMAPAEGRYAGDVEAIPGTFSGYWRRRSGLLDATQSLSAYDSGLRGTLQHLLAARLAENHGVSLHDDPGTARRLLCPHPRDESLWYWVDPSRPPSVTGNQPGISPRTLARLIDRLEQL